MAKRIRVSHPNIYHFIRNVVEFEDSSVDDVGSLAVGLVPTRHRTPSSVMNDERIQTFTAALLNNHNPSDEDIRFFLYNTAYSAENVMIDALGIPRYQ